MKPEFSGIERRLEKLSVCLKKLEPFQKKEKEELLKDPYLLNDFERYMEDVKAWLKDRDMPGQI